MISDERISELRKGLEASDKPLIFFDDDADGLCSFLLIYRWLQRGKGIIVKSKPELEQGFFRKVEEFVPDNVLVLDKPKVEQAFLDKLANHGITCYWLDHHPPEKRNHVYYFNPLLDGSDDNRPTAFWAYKVAQQDIWIAMVGTVGDWNLIPELKDEFIKQYPELLDKDTPEEAYFDSELGKLVKIFSFNLKGSTTEVNRSVKVLTRIDNPYEILKQRTPKGRYIYRKFEKMNKVYEEMMSQIKPTEEKIVLFTYKHDRISFTSDMSNELLYKYPDKTIFLAREKSGEMKCSIRSSDLILPPIINKALDGVDGYGGGHDHACGACIKVDDFDKFFKTFTLIVESQTH